MWIKVPKLSSLNLKKFMMNCFMLFPYRNIGLSVREGELIEELILSNDQSGDCTIIIVSIFSFNFMIWVFIVMRTLVSLSRKGLWYCVNPYLLRRLMNIMANSIQYPSHSSVTGNIKNSYDGIKLKNIQWKYRLNPKRQAVNIGINTL